MASIKAYFAQLANESPSQLIGTVVSILSAVLAFLASIQGSLVNVHGWGQVAFVVAAALVPLIQARYTRKLVASSIRRGFSAKLTG